MTPRHVPSIESLRCMPSFNSRSANASSSGSGSATADTNPNTSHHQWTPSLATPPNLAGHGHGSSSADAAAAAGMGIHRGAIDKTTVTTQPPPRVMAHVAGVLQAMGVEIQQESTYRFRCIRPKKGAVALSAGGPATLASTQTSEEMAHLAAPAPIPSRLSTSGLMASHCVSPLDDVSGYFFVLGCFFVSLFCVVVCVTVCVTLGCPSVCVCGSSYSGPTIRLLTIPLPPLFLQSRPPLSPLSPIDSPILQSFNPSSYSFSASTGPGAPTGAPVEVLYGSPPDDSHDEVRFSVELTRLEGLSGTYSLDEGEHQSAVKHSKWARTPDFARSQGPSIMLQNPYTPQF
ncbi:hypothetical protein D9619_008999 [Psilocybe cf. subviscida]|uniref:Uncharacterized protein n=1 Tax=Psilocybe cf. subviscida TaxID=2480587 RepID=A0A8H5FA66_9AGAR|nr:hypothetical protein D9619_008999 [Psilocybe cf. subviscida]